MGLTTASIGAELIEALGLPKGAVTDVTLRFPAKGVVTATVEFMPAREQLSQVLSILKRYELHETSSEEVPV